MIDRGRWQGELGYFDSSGARTGRELFSVSVHADGSRTLRAQCEMDDDALVRDVVLALGADGLPGEAFVRIVEGGRTSGSGWYRFDGNGAEFEVRMPAGEVRSGREEGRFPFFGTHALVNDGWLARLAARGTQSKLERLATCSLQANGGGVPGFHVTEASVDHVGDVPVEVAAGRFECAHFRVGYGDYQPLDMWVTGPELLLVQMSWEHLQGRYELLSLTSCSASPSNLAAARIQNSGSSSV
jgi:hypothetical protein